MKRKHNNRGFSLVEILIAFAILAVVSTMIMTFVSTSSGYYRRQSKSLRIQNELQEASNKITDALMEATEIRIDYSNNRICVYTGPDASYNNPDAKVKPKLIVWEKNTGKLYVYDNNNPDSGDEAYCLTQNCQSLSISVLNLDESGDTFSAPLMIKVDITLAIDEAERSDSKTTTIRNKVTKLSVRSAGSGSYKDYTLE